MSVLGELQPNKVFKYFEEICSIPHGSRNLQQISDYLVDFAKAHELKYRQDEDLNVIIWKDGSKGYEASEPVILQGHMDMVAVKEADCDKDMEKEGLDGHGLSDLINKKSGVAGLVGGSSDMRDLEAAVEAGDERATMVLDVYNYRIKKYIGAYAAAMGGCDILVWTGGVGENQWATRRVVCENMEYMGMKIDVEKNEGMRGEEMVISTPDSKVTIIVVPTDEEYMIAADTMDILGK